MNSVHFLLLSYRIHMYKVQMLPGMHLISLLIKVDHTAFISNMHKSSHAKYLSQTGMFNIFQQWWKK